MATSRTAGFTLIELMITLVVLAALIALGLPSFQSAIRSNRVTTASNELLTAFSLARSEAIRNTRGSAICASANGTSCGNDWNAGWLVWRDVNANTTLDAGEVVVRYTQGSGALGLTASVNTLGFDPRGRSRTGAQETFAVKPSGQSAPFRCVIVNVTGQPRIQKDSCP